MVRVKRGVSAHKRRQNLLKKAKGYRFGRSKKFRQAKEAVLHAGKHAFAHRRHKKGDFRRLWTVKINAAIRPFGMSYSVFINKLAQKKILLNRKMLAEIAEKSPESFKQIVASVA